MKKAYLFLLTAALLYGSACMTGCVGNQTSQPAPNVSAAEPGAPNENDSLINGFDIRTICDYPEIETAIRVSTNTETRELTRDDFLRVTSLDLYDMGIEDIAPLAALSNLTELNATGNRVADLSPLAGLDKLAVSSW